MKDKTDKPKSKGKKEKQYLCDTCKDTGWTGWWPFKKPCHCGQADPFII